MQDVGDIVEADRGRYVPDGFRPVEGCLVRRLDVVDDDELARAVCGDLPAESLCGALG